MCMKFTIEETEVLQAKRQGKYYSDEKQWIYISESRYNLKQISNKTTRIPSLFYFQQFEFSSSQIPKTPQIPCSGVSRAKENKCGGS